MASTIPSATLPPIRRVELDAPLHWLAAGWRDFRAAPAVSLAMGMIVVIIGFLLTFGLVAAGYFYLTAPLVVGSVNRQLGSGVPTSSSWRRAGCIFTPSTSHHTSVSLMPGSPGT